MQFQLNPDGSVSYRLTVANLVDLHMAHIHLAPPGVNGPIIVWLYPSAPPAQHIPGRTSGILATGTFTADDFMNDLAGQPMSALLEAVAAGNAYVNVHALDLPAGEIRGQLEAHGWTAP